MAPEMKNRRPKMYGNFLRENEVTEMLVDNILVAEDAVEGNAGPVSIPTKSVPPENLVKQNASKKTFVEEKEESKSCIGNDNSINDCSMKDESCTIQDENKGDKHGKDICLDVKEMSSDEKSDRVTESYKIKEVVLSEMEDQDKIDPKILKEINEILKILREFGRQLKSKDTFSDVEILNIEDKECKSFYLNYFSDFVRDYELSDEFIYRRNAKHDSESLLFYSIDFKYAIQVVSNKELTVSVRNFKHFCDYFERNPNSYISRLAGIYLTPNKGFVVMENILSSKCNKIDGFGESSISQPVSDSSAETIRQCQGIQYRDILPLEKRDSTISSIQKDTDFLRSLNLVDYSLVINCNSFDVESFRAFNSKGQELKCIVDDISSIGITDVFTEYDLSKKIERIWNILCCNSGRGSVNPEMYQVRLMDTLYNEYFEDENNNVNDDIPEN